MPKKKGCRGKYEYWLTHEGLIKIEGWARDGLNNEQIAHNMGITDKTLYEWQNKYTDICEALKKGKEVVDREVENALHRRAMGYEYDEITSEPVEDKETGEITMGVTKTVRKHMAPDVTAQIFWLKNRKPQDWRDKKDVAVEGAIPVVLHDNVSD